MRVAFRVDSGPEIGAGHLMRCLTLAKGLRTHGIQSTFVSRAHDGNLSRLVQENRFDLVMLPRTQTQLSRDPGTWLGRPRHDDALETFEALGSHGPLEWVISDHYAIDSTWHDQLRPRARQLMAIDDLPNRFHDVDLLLDHNVSAESKPWSALVPRGTRLLLGPRFALIDPAFADIGRTRVFPPLDAPKESWTVPERILVSFGGTDPDDLTRTTVQTLRAALPRTRVVVVVGAAYPAVEALLSQATTDSNLEVHVQTDEMASLLAGVDLAFGAGGISLLERMAAGVPTAVVTTAQNQEAGVRALAQQGCILSVGSRTDVTSSTLTDALTACSNCQLTWSMASRSRTLVDGHGVLRVLDAMGASPQIEIRLASPEDSGRIWEWRNDPGVRTWMRSTELIPWETHAAWFTDVTRDPDRLLLLGEDTEGSIGVVRYDINRYERTAEVSIYLAPQRRGRGLGPRLLRRADARLAELEPNVDSIVASVLTGNERSADMFRNCGYTEHSTTLIRHLRDAPS